MVLSFIFTYQKKKTLFFFLKYITKDIEVTSSLACPLFRVEKKTSCLFTQLLIVITPSKLSTPERRITVYLSLSLSLSLHKVSHFWALPSQTIYPASFTHIHTNQTWVSSISAKKLYFSDTLKLLHSDGCKLSQLLNFPHYIDPPQKNCQRLLLSLSRIWPFKVPLGFLIQNWKKSKRLTQKKKAKLWLVVKSMEVLQTWAFYFKTKGFLVLLGSLSLSGFPALSLLFMVILSTFGAVFVFGF